jgi:hypothetical protein
MTPEQAAQRRAENRANRLCRECGETDESYGICDRCVIIVHKHYTDSLNLFKKVYGQKDPNSKAAIQLVLELLTDVRKY